MARIIRLPDRPHGTLREAVDAWSDAAEFDPAFADDLERVSAEDRPPDTSWAS